MNTWKYLPVDILELIFDAAANYNYIVEKVLCQCQLTCKIGAKPFKDTYTDRFILENMKLSATLHSSESNPARIMSGIALSQYGQESLIIEFFSPTSIEMYKY
jgi:hypothetical protein